jgi:hypothetical protein
MHRLRLGVGLLSTTRVRPRQTVRWQLPFPSSTASGQTTATPAHWSAGSLGRWSVQDNGGILDVVYRAFRQLNRSAPERRPSTSSRTLGTILEMKAS